MARVLIDINETNEIIKLVESDGWYESESKKGSHGQFKHLIF